MKTSDFLKLLKKHPIFIENEVMVNEAIKELEDLENITCDGCIHIFKSNNLECSTCLRNYTDRWESRNESL